MISKKRFITYFIPLLGFVLTLLAVNGYQYFRMKNDFSARILLKTSEIEMQELQRFFTDIEEKLKLIMDWGVNDVLLSEDIVRVNKKLIPLVKRQQPIGGIIIANNKGKEYFLHRNTDTFITRSCVSINGSAKFHYQEWDAHNSLIKDYQETAQYDPRQRPWFITPAPENRDKISWTGVYPFFHTNELGVTASVAWYQDGQAGDYIVLGIDIPLRPLIDILANRKTERPGTLFILKENGKSIIIRDEINNAINNEKKQSKNTDLEKIIGKLAKEWRTAGKPADEFIRIKEGKQQWLGVFQKINQPNGVFWLGLTTPEEKFTSLIRHSFLSVDFVDLIIATIGGALVLLFMHFFSQFNSQRPSRKSPSQKVLDYIEKGEGERIEFKSTIRMNLKTEKKGKEIELAWLKSVVAFLNSTGGALLIGVNDDGEVCGLEADQFENSDKCLLHVKNLINQHIGAEFSMFLETSLVNFGNKEMILLECQKTSDAVFLKIGKNEEFYIRSGPSSTKLSPSQIVNFVKGKNG